MIEALRIQSPPTIRIVRMNAKNSAGKFRFVE